MKEILKDLRLVVLKFKTVWLGQIAIIACLLLVACVVDAQTDNVNKYFRKTMTVSLSDKVIIGEISTLDVYKEKFLVVDAIGKTTCLFNSHGVLLKRLNADHCYPGFNFSPLNAEFSQSGTILMTNSAPWGLRFDQGGNCSGGMDRYFVAPLNFCFSRTGFLYGYFLGEDRPYLSKMDTLGKTLKKIPFPAKLKNLASRIEGGGIFSDSNGLIYVSDSVDPTVFEFNEDLAQVGELNDAPSHYRKIQSDIGYFHRDPSGLMRAVSKAMKDNTFIRGIFLLEKGRILVQYVNSRRYMAQIIDLKGDPVIKENIVCTSPFVQAKDGLGYQVRQPEPTKSGMLPNPQIVVFKYIGK